MKIGGFSWRSSNVERIYRNSRLTGVEGYFFLIGRRMNKEWTKKLYCLWLKKIKKSENWKLWRLCRKNKLRFWSFVETITGRIWYGLLPAWQIISKIEWRTLMLKLAKMLFFFYSFISFLQVRSVLQRQSL